MRREAGRVTCPVAYARLRANCRRWSGRARVRACSGPTAASCVARERVLRDVPLSMLRHCGGSLLPPLRCRAPSPTLARASTCAPARARERPCVARVPRRAPAFLRLAPGVGARAGRARPPRPATAARALSARRRWPGRALARPRVRGTAISRVARAPGLSDTSARLRGAERKGSSFSWWPFIAETEEVQRAGDGVVGASGLQSAGAAGGGCRLIKPARA